MPTLIAQLSPAAAKLYLALHLYPNPAANPPIAQISLENLSADTNMSERSLSNALRVLVDLKLITRLPKHPHAPSRYQIHPLPNPHPFATLHPDSHPVATHFPPNAQPAATLRGSDSQPAATLNHKTPIPAPKTHNAHPAATHSTLPLTPAEEELLSDPAILKFLMSTLTPEETTHVLAAAHRTLVRLGPEDQT